MIHPQHWPEDFDATGKRIVVIGSGATAVTLVPSLAPDAEHVTMLQRTPSYILSLPGRDPLAEWLRNKLPATARLSDRAVEERAALHRAVPVQPPPARRRAEAHPPADREAAAAGLDVDTHFNPPYDPWDQRLCLVPDGDLFRTLRRGDASIATGRIARFTEKGVALESGEHLDADVIVTATGLNLLAMGGMSLSLDGQPVDLSETVSYKGMMISGVPNFSMVIGYTNASWTLKADLVNRYVCRLLAHLDAARLRLGHAGRAARGRRPAVPRPRVGLRAAQPGRACPSRARARRGGCTRTTSATSQLMRRGPLDDEGMTFQPRRPAASTGKAAA